MPPPRLLQSPRRNRPSGTAANNTNTPSSHSRPSLPPYEPPAHPLNEAGKRALADLSSNRETRRYDVHLSRSVEHLRKTVGAVNDVLASRRTKLANVTERRKQANTGEKSETELRLEEEVARLETEVAELTERAEAAVRQVIDYRAELEDEKAVLETVLRGAAAQKLRAEKPILAKREARRRSRGEDEDEDADEDAEEEEDEEMPDVAAVEEEETPLTGAPELLEAARKAKADEYATLTVHQRYALQNDYIAFKKMWHDALHQDDGEPLPDASTWFDAQGRPALGAAAADDDDLVVQREIIDLNCPLTLARIKVPYISQVCKHVFEKDAITDFLRSSGNRLARCPVCRREVRVSDFVYDEVTARRLKRAEEADRREREREEEESDVDADESLIAGRSVNVKKERQRNRQVAEDAVSESE